VSVIVGVGVTVGVRVFVGVFVFVGEGVIVGVSVEVGLGVNDDVIVGDGVKVGDEVCVCIGVGLARKERLTRALQETEMKAIVRITTQRVLFDLSGFLFVSILIFYLILVGYLKAQMISPIKELCRYQV
jgi:hypothetical protein